MPKAFSEPIRDAGRFDRKWKVFFLVAVSIFMSTLDSSIVNVALPYMMQDLSSDVKTIQWVVLIYLTTVSSLLLTCGRLSDIKGRKHIYIGGFLVFVAGSLLCGLAESSRFLIVSRAIQGGGAAMLMACSPALIVDAFPAEERGKAIGMVGAVVAAGLTTGPVVGGILLEFFSWRYIFYINIPIGVVASFVALTVLDNPPARHNTDGQVIKSEPMDTLGGLLMAVGLSSVILFLTQVPDQGLFSPFSLGTAGLGAVAMILFVFIETRLEYPLFDFNLLKIRRFVFPMIGSVILFATLFIVIFLMPFFLTYPCGFSAFRTGFIMMVPFLCLLVISPVSGLIHDRYGSRTICMAGMGLVAVSLILLTGLNPSMTTGSMLWRMTLAGLGTALYISPNSTLIMSSVPVARRGIAAGALATARNMGMVLGVALAGLVFTHSFSTQTQGMSLDNYTPALEPFFMVSFKRAMATGTVLSVLGLAVTYARGKETQKEIKNHFGGVQT